MVRVPGTEEAERHLKLKKTTRRQRQAPTIADVARLAGVSPMTVSRVINGESNVRADTRQRVDEAIAKLGYAPNLAARHLAGGSQIVIGLLYSNPSAAYLSEFLLGGLHQAGLRSVQFVVEAAEEDHEAAMTARRMIERGVDGLLLSPPMSDSLEVLAVLEETDTPGVVVAGSRPCEVTSVVGIDDYAAAQAMTRHLIALGHEEIGFIVGDLNHKASERRLAGFRDVLSAAGLPPREQMVVQGHFSYRSGLECAERLLDLPAPPTAIFASNDDMAAATVAVAHRRGLDVPRDLTVCGFDDTALATTIWPELTTIRQPIEEMSRTAVDILVKEIRARRAGARGRQRHEMLGFTLVQRRSDGPPPPRKKDS